MESREEGLREFRSLDYPPLLNASSPLLSTPVFSLLWSIVTFHFDSQVFLDKRNGIDTGSFLPPLSWIWSILWFFLFLKVCFTEWFGHFRSLFRSNSGLNTGPQADFGGKSGFSGIWPQTRKIRIFAQNRSSDPYLR